MHKVTVANDKKFPLESFNLKAIKLSAEKTASSIFKFPIKLGDITPNLFNEQGYATCRLWSEDLVYKIDIKIFKLLRCRVDIFFELSTGKAHLEVGFGYTDLGNLTNGDTLANLVIDHTGKVIDSKIK